MFEITVLASGSKGNATLITCGTTRLLIDAGLSAKKLTEQLAIRNVPADTLTGILITHEHRDHTAGLRVLCAKREIPCYANRMTVAALEAQATPPQCLWQIFSTGTPFSIGPFSIEPFTVPHDAVEPVGFLIHHANATFGLLTDLGHVSAAIIERLQKVDTLLIESNYDEELLINDPQRSWSLKQRIRSPHGHLSNTSAAEALNKIAQHRISRVLLGHLSQDCNRPELASAAAHQAFATAGRTDVEICCLKPNAQLRCEIVGR